jgi:aminopeptidase-like protein
MALDMTRAQGGTAVHDIGTEIHGLITELFPICRSITGNGVRETLSIIGRHIPLEIHEVPTGTEVFDWTVPKEWNIRDAYIKNSRGEKVVDYRKSNLHVVNYSTPVRIKMPLEDLKKHVFSLPEYPDRIPYRTSYYNESWGFCLAHNDLLRLRDGEYEVCIDSKLEPGHLTYGEYLIKGESDAEVLISTHICHPSLANDNLSGVALATFLARELGGRRSRYSYRFLFVPGTIGSITWLCRNQGGVDKIKHGLVLVDVGDAGKFTYKKSRRGEAEVDRAVIHVLKHSTSDYDARQFDPYGHDERQYCSPGFNLPVGCFSRTPHGEFPEYHTSADDLTFVRPEYLSESFAMCLSILSVLDDNRRYVNLNPMCEPQLGKRGLYRMIGGPKDGGVQEVALLWTLNFSDGAHSLLDISERSGIKFDVVKKAADALLQHELLGALPE